MQDGKIELPESNKEVRLHGPIIFSDRSTAVKQFQSILVGVDLSWGDWLVAEELSPPNSEAVRQATWLAKLNGAALHYLFALDLSARAADMLAESGDHEKTILDQAHQQLERLTRKAHAEGIQATYEVVVGHSWLTLIQGVLRNNHDLLIVGTRHLSATQGFLFGSTDIKLLRKCPCAVWITQPWIDKQFDTVLVAHDMRPVGDQALELGASMAALQNAKLFVVHAAELEDLKGIMPVERTAEHSETLRRTTEAHVLKQLKGSEPNVPHEILFSLESPAEAIQTSAENYQVDLLVMGTLGRSGIAGMLIGNTAERLLPKLNCSLLAIKPPGFVSPVTLS